ncbi:MAG TPA: hypothetical protein VGK46_08795, partial [Saprospiraceae bacterium]
MRIALWGTGLTLLLLLSSCNSKKYLQDDQSFLMRNKIVLKSDYPIDNKAELSEQLYTLYRQPQTKYALIVPRHVNYYKYQNSLAKRPNRKKWDEEKLIKNRPVIFDSLKADQTRESLQNFLGLKGYRSAYVTYEAKTSDKKTKVVYQANPGPRLYIDTLSIITHDTNF